MQRLLIMVCLSACALAAADDRTNALADFSGALERLAATMGPAVVLRVGSAEILTIAVQLADCD